MQNRKLRTAIAITIAVMILTVTMVQANALYEAKTTLIDRFQALINNHRDVADYVSVGKSTQGKEIWMFRIGNKYSNVILWDAQIHGGEDMGSEIEFLMAKWLLESGETAAKSMVSTNYILFIPSVDIDTAVRTNSHHVNLNRNFIYNWKYQGSTYSTSNDYRGPYAGSEKETQVMRYVFGTYWPKFYVNTHMWGGPVMYSWVGNSYTLLTKLKSEVASVSSARGVTPYPWSAAKGYGYAIGDAGYYYKAASFLLELNNAGSPAYTPPSYSTVTSYYYPKCLSILIAMGNLV